MLSQLGPHAPNIVENPPASTSVAEGLNVFGDNPGGFRPSADVSAGGFFETIRGGLP